MRIRIKGALMNLAEIIAEREQDYFGRYDAAEDERPVITAAIEAAGLEVIEVRFFDGGLDDSWQISGREVVAEFCFPWEDCGTGSCRRDLCAVRPVPVYHGTCRQCLHVCEASHPEDTCPSCGCPAMEWHSPGVPG